MRMGRTAPGPDAGAGFVLTVHRTGAASVAVSDAGAHGPTLSPQHAPSTSRDHHTSVS